MKVALLSCCAPCSVGAIAQLADRKYQIANNIADFIVLFYNPNIYPETEYQKRLAEQIKLCESLNVKYHVGTYDHDDWLVAVAGLENEPERGRRCSACFAFRIKWAARWAADNGYDAIATVFGVSKHKDQGQVDEAAKREIGNLEYIKIDLYNGPPPTRGMYQQNYCGCEFSINR